MTDNTKEKKKCPNCGGDIAVRNPTGKCDHLYYPENVPKDTNPKQDIKEAKGIDWSKKDMYEGIGRPDLKPKPRKQEVEEILEKFRKQFVQYDEFGVAVGGFEFSPYERIQEFIVQALAAQKAEMVEKLKELKKEIPVYNTMGVSMTFTTTQDEKENFTYNQALEEVINLILNK